MRAKRSSPVFVAHTPIVYEFTPRPRPNPFSPLKEGTFETPDLKAAGHTSTRYSRTKSSLSDRPMPGVSLSSNVGLSTMNGGS